MVTIADVARHAGVSPKTVSNVLNGYKYLRPETRARVEASIEELGYTVNLAARGLRRGRTGMITLAVTDLRQPYLAELAGAVIRAAHERSVRVIIIQTDGERGKELDLLHGPNRHSTDGVIMGAAALGPDDVGEYDVDFPLVLLGERVTHPDLDRVTLPNEDAARALTTYLIGLGCRRIVLLGQDDARHHGSAPLREAGFRRAHADAGLEVDEALVVAEGEWYLPSGTQAVNELIARGERFDGVFAMNDALAIGALHGFHAHGIEVPGQVKVTGIDNIADAASTSPTLTSLAVDQEGFARRAVDLLLMRIEESRRDEGLPRYPQQTVQADFSIQVRQSTEDRAPEHGPAQAGEATGQAGQNRASGT